MVDSAIIIDRLRRGADIRQELVPYLASGSLYNCGVIRAEVTRGFKSLRLKVEMTAFFDIIPEVPTTAKLWREAAELAWFMDRTAGGHRPLTDLVIAKCALQVGATLVSPDGHFEDIIGLKVAPALP